MSDSNEEAVSVNDPKSRTAPPFQPERFQDCLQETGFTQDQREEYLRLLWSIMLTFVDLGFGIDSVQLLLPTDGKNESPESIGDIG